MTSPEPATEFTEISPEAVSEQLRPAMTKLYVTYFRKATQSSLTGPQLTILSHLEDGRTERISEIARQEGIRMPTASNTLHQLEHRELVARVRDTSDRRGVLVQITEKGKQELTKVGDERTRYFAQMLSTLDESELQQLTAVVPLIHKMADNY